MNFLELKKRAILTSMTPSLVLIVKNSIKSKMTARMLCAPSLRIAASIPSCITTDAIVSSLPSILVNANIKGDKIIVEASVPSLPTIQPKTEVHHLINKKMISRIDVLEQILVNSNIDLNKITQSANLNTMQSGEINYTNITFSDQIKYSELDVISGANIESYSKTALFLMNEVLIPSVLGIDTEQQIEVKLRNEFELATLANVGAVTNIASGFVTNINNPNAIKTIIGFKEFNFMEAPILCNAACSLTSANVSNSEFQQNVLLDASNGILSIVGINNPQYNRVLSLVSQNTASKVFCKSLNQATVSIDNQPMMLYLFNEQLKQKSFVEVLQANYIGTNLFCKKTRALASFEFAISEIINTLNSSAHLLNPTLNLSEALQLPQEIPLVTDTSSNLSIVRHSKLSDYSSLQLSGLKDNTINEIKWWNITE